MTIAAALLASWLCVYDCKRLHPIAAHMRKLTTYLYIYRKIRNKLDPASNEKPLFCFVFVLKQQNGCNNSTAEVTHDAIELKMFA